MAAESFGEALSEALDEFESFANRRAATVASKGKNDGLRKLGAMFKSARTLEQRAAAYDAAWRAGDRAAGQQQATKALKVLQARYVDLNDALKKNLAAFRAQQKEASPDDRDLRTGYSVFLNRLEQIRKQAKSDVELRTRLLKEAAGKTVAADARLKSDLKRVYLNLSKAIEDSEARMKVLIARPTEGNVTAILATSDGNGVRGIAAAVHEWNALERKHESLVKALDPTVPDHLLRALPTLEDKVGRPAFWREKLRMDEDGWEERAKQVAEATLKQLPNWRRLAESIKALSR